MRFAQRMPWVHSLLPSVSRTSRMKEGNIPPRPWKTATRQRWLPEQGPGIHMRQLCTFARGFTLYHPISCQKFFKQHQGVRG